jgi:hypothetical protein
MWRAKAIGGWNEREGDSHVGSREEKEARRV